MIPADLDDGYHVEYRDEQALRRDLNTVNRYLGYSGSLASHFRRLPVDDYAAYLTAEGPTVVQQENGRPTLVLDWSNSVLGGREDLLAHREHRKPDVKRLIGRIRARQRREALR